MTLKPPDFTDPRVVAFATALANGQEMQYSFSHDLNSPWFKLTIKATGQTVLKLSINHWAADGASWSIK